MAETETQTILVVEDEELMRTILRQILEAADYRVVTADRAESAISAFSANEIAVTLTDIKMPGGDGLSLLDQIKSIDGEAVVIVMTAFSSTDTAVASLRKGAYDYITKPFVNEELLQTVKNAVTQRQLFRENRLLRRELRRQFNFAEIVGTSDQLRHVFDIVNKVADTSASVLIQGESGTGKELIARAIHFNSSRSEKPFLAINCGALPESLLESELFGHTRGSFTGAIADKRGHFRSASGGTLFLDEIGEMPLPLQVKLLRALQEHEVTPVGSSVAESFDTRILAASNRDLEAEVEAGRFREDLYYRLNVIEITVPPLRDRRDDIPLLVKHFVARSSHRQNVPEKPVSNEATHALLNYHWPGNVRELENAIERAFILSADEIDLVSLPPKVRTFDSKHPRGESLPATLEDLERRYVLATLESVEDDKARAADILGIDLSTLYRKLKRYADADPSF